VLNDDPATLREHAKLFERTARPTAATQSPARALRFMADAMEARDQPIIGRLRDEATTSKPDKLAATG
jgi:hypothetical protein